MENLMKIFEIGFFNFETGKNRWSISVSVETPLGIGYLKIYPDGTYCGDSTLNTRPADEFLKGACDILDNGVNAKVRLNNLINKYMRDIPELTKDDKMHISGSMINLYIAFKTINQSIQRCRLDCDKK